MDSNDLYQQAIEFYCNLAVVDPRRYFLEAWHDCYTWRGKALLAPLNLWGHRDMVRGKANAKPAKSTGDKWSTTFVDIPLAGHSWEGIAGTWDTPEELYEIAATILEEGYRLGFSYNAANDSFICSVTCKAEESVNNGKTFTAFAGSWYEALQTALYKHYVVAEQNWGGGVPGSNRPTFG